MQIIATRDPIRNVKKHDRILLRWLAQRAHEWQSQRGIRRLIARIKIEVWAWRETAREQRRLHGV
jgi:hypothetical protein